MFNVDKKEISGMIIVDNMFSNYAEVVVMHQALYTTSEEGWLFPRRPSSVLVVLNSLRERIMFGDIPANGDLTEVSLSIAYRVSRSTIRSALQELEKEGLVVTLPNGRRQTTEFGEGSIEELYEVRLILERHAINSIVSSSKEKRNSIAELLRNIHSTETENHEENAETSALERVALDAKFHKRIVELAGNYSLLKCWNTLEGAVWTILRVNALYGNYQRHLHSYRLHKVLIQEIQNGSPKAMELLEEHLEVSKSLALEVIHTVPFKTSAQ